jgi:CDP-paratose 2-epimerase
MLELKRLYCPDAKFVYTSTNKVYGDNPNKIKFIEKKTRWEVSPTNKFYKGIDETFSIDQCTHSFFGVSKAYADLLCQEYSNNFGLNVACFRAGCITGPNHSGAKLHGFLSYLVKACIHKKSYDLIGYKGKQVRDNIHSWDLVNMFWHFHQNPKLGEVYNAGGGRFSNCSMLEAIEKCEQISGKKLNYTLSDQARSGDHIWYISNVNKFKNHYPEWDLTIGPEQILKEIFAGVAQRSQIV